MIDPLWKLSEGLSLRDAAFLIAGYDPCSAMLFENEDDFYKNFPRYVPVIRALEHSVRTNKLDATIIWLGDDSDFENDQCSQCYEEKEFDFDKTIIEVEKLRTWLSSKGYQEGFFYPESAASPDFLDPKNEYFSLKLAAAISAWKEVTAEPTLMRGTTAKQAMMKWLRRNADKFGLAKDDGNPNEQGIEEIAKIANWDNKGGAPKTPG